MARRLEWSEFARWFDELQGDEGDLWHRTIIHPGILKVIGPVRGLDILDVGCGNGSLARQLARAGNRVTGIDGSAPIIEFAKRREAANPLGIDYRTCDAARMEMFAADSFDLVVTTMALMDMPDAASAIKEMGRVVRRSGRCVMLFSHPCFDVPGASSWLIERDVARPAQLSRRVSRYREIFGAWLAWSSQPESPELYCYHRPLSWYFRAIAEAGLAVTMLAEPEPTPEFCAASPDNGEALTQFPMHCVIEARPCPPDWRRQ